MVSVSGFRLSGSGSEVEGLGFEVWGLKIRVQETRVQEVGREALKER